MHQRLQEETESTTAENKVKGGSAQPRLVEEQAAGSLLLTAQPWEAGFIGAADDSDVINFECTCERFRRQEKHLMVGGERYFRHCKTPKDYLSYLAMFPWQFHVVKRTTPKKFYCQCLSRPWVPEVRFCQNRHIKCSHRIFKVGKDY